MSRFAARAKESRCHNQNAPTTSKTELLSFLGMCNYLLPYIPKLKDMTSILCELSKAKVEFTWNEHYDRAFREVKYHVANAVTLKYFDPNVPITIKCDTSGVGIGGTLLRIWSTCDFCFQSSDINPEKIQ